MNRRGIPLVACVAVSACLSCSAQADRGESAGETVPRLVPLPATEHVGGLAREPMIVETADGVLFVTGYGGEAPALWRSADGGRTWTSVDVGGAADGAVGNSDVDLALGPDGTLYFTAMSFDRQAFEGTGIAIASSDDGGASWHWTSLSHTRYDDRPWVEVAPDGTAHVIWNDGAGVRHVVSADGGETWTERARIHDMGGSSHLAIAPDGAIAVRITPLSASGNRYDPGVDHLAVSADGGASWVLRKLPDTLAWNPTFEPGGGVLRWVEPVAWDSAGALYSLWSAGTTLRLARSTDRGATWTQWPLVEDSVTVFFPYLVARANGELAATWYSGSGDALRANVAYIRFGDATGRAPTVVRVEPFEVAAFTGSDTGEPPTRDTAGEYVPVIFLRDGRLAVVTTIQDPAQDRLGFTFRPFRLERDGGAGAGPIRP